MIKQLSAKLKSLPEGIKQAGAIITALIAICGAIAGVDAWVMNRAIDTLKEEITPLKEEVDEIQLDTTRLQLMTLINNDPNNTEAITKLARKYFVELGGDWYMTAIFNEWCLEHDVHVNWAMPL